MERKHDRTDAGDTRPCWDEVRHSKRVRQENPDAETIIDSAHDSTLEQLNRPVVSMGIYTGRLEANEARLLVLHPGSGSAKIKCDLRQIGGFGRASLGKVLPYDALSYVWGEEHNPACIALCGHDFYVTRNLATALTYLRSPDSDRTLWVDAICINQYDIKEKNSQVLSMHRIYKFAKLVIAWLGPPDDTSSSAFSSMKAIDEGHLLPLSTVIICSISNEAVTEDDDPIRKLLDRDYWTRAWIVQELMSAQSLVIQCGSDVVPYSALEKSFPRNKSASIQISSENNKSERTLFRGDSEVDVFRVDSDQISCSRYLDCFLNRKCRERRDNIFAFLNLLGGNIKQEISDYYNADISELVRVSAQAIIKSTRSLHIIVIKGRQTPPSAQGCEKWQLDMPSWCPYWATPYQCRAIGPQSRIALFARKAVVTFKTNRMQVKGFVIGKVRETISRESHDLGVCGGWDEANIERERKHYLRCLYLGLLSLPGKVKRPLEMQLSILATNRTLLAGREDITFDTQTLLRGEPGQVEGPEVTGLREMWIRGKSRLVCSFRLGQAVKRALYTKKAAPPAWINRIALVPGTVKQGDFICAILGCTTPVVLRKIGKHYHVLGEAYVDTSAMGRFRVKFERRNFILE
ncbi:heterokaryon incompatibility protein-domain-containing protein [Paraphoma chrysanthemicola]|nr:heterokaryon incompatibility protein-domain-containing protein [Paraphoma chrysanthemicola]